MSIRISFAITSVVAALYLMALPVVQAEVACGDVINTDTMLTENLVCSLDNDDRYPVLTVQGPATLDLNGFSVICVLDPDATNPLEVPNGIQLTGEGATLLNGSVDHCWPAKVNLKGTGRHRVEWVVAGNLGLEGLKAGTSFLIHPGSDKNVLTKNASIYASKGFVLHGSKSTLSNNTAGGSNEQGFEIFGSQHLLRENVSVLNDVSGFELEGTQFKLFRNIAQQNTTGFSFVDDDPLIENSGHTLVQNQANGHDGQGIQLWLGTTDSELTDNTSLGNRLFDMVDDNPNCDSNFWADNVFGTSNLECID